MRIASLKRFLTDWETANPDKKPPKPVIKEKKIAPTATPVKTNLEAMSFVLIISGC